MPSRQQSSTIPGQPVIGTPVIRKRQPMAEKTTTSKEQDAEHMKRQKEAGKRLLEKQQTDKDAQRGMHVSSKLTTGAHKGKIDAEPDKPDAMERKKVGETERTGVESVSTVPQHTDGEVTDLVVTDPPTGVAGAASPKTEAQRTAKAARGDGKAKKSARKR